MSCAGRKFEGALPERFTTIVAFGPVPRVTLIWPVRCGGATSCTLRPIRHVCWNVAAAVATAHPPDISAGQDQYDVGSVSSTRVTLASGWLSFAPKKILRLTELTR